MKKRLTALTLAFALGLGTTALAAGAEKTISVTSMKLTVNGQEVTPTKSDGTAAEIFAYDGATYAPIRYMAELLGVNVEWDKNEPDTAKLAGVPNFTAPSSPSGGLQDGKYVTTARGHENLVQVATTFQDGAIKEVEVLTHDETVGIGNYAVDVIPGRIVEAQSVNVDVVSGCTFTSMAITSAVRAAIQEAGGDVKEFSAKTAKEVTPSQVEETVDLVVVGAGTAGLIAANRALEKGLNVLVFEKMDIPGGAMAMTYSGLMAAGSDMQIAWDGEKAATAEEYIAFSKSRVTPENAVRGTDLPYWSEIYNASGEVINWLQSIGVGFATMGIRHGSTPFLAPGPYQGGCGYAMEYMAQRIPKLGGRVIYATPVTELLQAKDGTVTGVVARGEDGKTWTVHAKTTLLATGGFGNNKEMMNEYYPQYKDEMINCPKGSTGEGIQMGIKAGAKVECMGRTLGSFLSAYQSRYELAFMHYTTPGLIVNVNGDSIGNITKNNHPMLAAALADPVNERTFYYVIDEAARQRSKKCIVVGNGLTFGVSYEAVFETGEAVHYDSLEAAAEALDLPNLVQTIENNNAHSRKNEADEFGRSNLPLIDDRDGIWMLRVIPTCYLTTGGLACDTDGRILREDESVILGLYGAGDVLGSLEEKDGNPYGMGFDSALMFGYVVGDAIAANEFGK